MKDTLKEIRTTSSDEELVLRRRKAIAEAGLKVFLEKGYDKATMREIGDACGMTYGNLYNYIGSKEDIRRLILMKDLGGADNLKQLRRELSDLSYSQLLAECITVFLKGMDTMTKSLLFFDREIYKFSREERRLGLGGETAIVSFFEELLGDGIKAGDFKVRNPFLLAHDILMYGHDWAVRKWFLKQYITLDEYIKERVQMVISLVTPETGITEENG